MFRYYLDLVYYTHYSSRASRLKQYSKLPINPKGRVPHLSHAQIVDGLDSEPIIERLKETVGDETKHAKLFRHLIGSYLGGVPSMSIAETHDEQEHIAELKLLLAL